MKPVAAIIYEDPCAARIGQTYRKGVEAYQETGRMLIAQKHKLGHGKWLPWLKANEAVLGFGESTARRLMRWANEPGLDAETVWGNEGRDRSSTTDLTREMAEEFASDLAEILARVHVLF